MILFVLYYKTPDTMALNIQLWTCQVHSVNDSTTSLNRIKTYSDV